MTTEQMLTTIRQAMDAKSALNITQIDVSGKTCVADYFVICSGKSTTQVKAIADAVEAEMEKQGEFAKRREGYPEGRWIAIDYSNVIVHVFIDEVREYYQLDKLWM